MSMTLVEAVREYHELASKGVKLIPICMFTQLDLENKEKYLTSVQNEKVDEFVKVINKCTHEMREKVDGVWRASKALRIGQNCFFNGGVYEISSETSGHWGLFNKETNRVIGQPKSSCEPVIDEVFKVGDHVQSKHSFKGTVEGFDHRHNRAFCISDKIDCYTDTRVRYSYGVKEISRIREEKKAEQLIFEIYGVPKELICAYGVASVVQEEKIKFVRNAQYKINGEKDMYVYVDSNGIYLINVHDVRDYYKVNEFMSKAELRDLGVYNIQKRKIKGDA